MLSVRFILLLICLSFSVFSFTGTYPARQEPWKAPAWTDTLINPYLIEPLTLPQAQEIYMLYCTSCHGIQGQGNGPGLKDPASIPPDFRNEKIKNQSDGSLYWKIREGRVEMPSFRGRLSEEQHWQLVEYIRDLSRPFHLQKNPLKSLNN